MTRLISLLIDTRISAEEEKKLTENLEFLERVGLSQIQQEPMDRVALRDVLQRGKPNRSQGRNAAVYINPPALD